MVTFEYCVWKGINDGDEDIKALIKYCKQIPSKVNLIQYNPIGDGKYDQCNKKAEENYVRQLENAGITVMIRKSRGGDIDAACGQLANKTVGLMIAFWTFLFYLSTAFLFFLYYILFTKSSKIKMVLRGLYFCL